MAGNSLHSILEWMKNPQNQVMWGWDAIAAMERSKINTLLLQEYTGHLTGNAYLPRVEGEVEMVTGRWKEYIHDFLLDAPRLSFEDADLDNSKAKLTCSILGGVHLTMKYDVNRWLTEKIIEIDPLQGPELSLDLDLAQLGGNVDSDGRVYLDLRYSDNFRLTFAQTDHEQMLGGDIFKALFKELPPEQRICVLGTIQPGSDETLRPQSFKLRTQASGAEARDRRSPHYGDGALLVFICMTGGAEGGGISSSYPYLIADDAGQEYSATVLLSHERIGRAVPLMDYAIGLVAALMGRREFTYVHDAHGQLVSATVKGGGLRIPESLTRLLPLPVGGRNIDIEIHQAAVEFSGSSPEALKLLKESDGRVSISWRSQAIQTTTITFPGSEYPATVMQSLLTVILSGHYAFAEGASSDFVIRPSLTVRINREDIDSSSTERAGGEWLVIIAYITAQLAIMTRAPIEPKVRDALDKSLAMDISLGGFIHDCIELSFGNAIEGDVIRVPRDIGCFGRINPTRTQFQISPLHPLMLAGAQQQFVTEPPLEGMNWALSDVPDDTSDLGSITSTGLYTPPAASAIKGPFTRVRVTARRAGFSSSALVTVLVNELTINPLIQLCSYGQSVELAAADLGGGQLHWEIKNWMPGSGRVEPSELPEGDHRYVAGPVVSDKAYVLDEIEVSNPDGEKRSAWVLVRQRDSIMTVRPSWDPLLPSLLQLQALIRGNPVQAEWTLPMGGPGTIGSDGLYRSSTTPTTARFVLIFAGFNDEQWGRFEAHIILPLPLNKFSSELELMRA